MTGEWIVRPEIARQAKQSCVYQVTAPSGLSVYVLHSEIMDSALEEGLTGVAQAGDGRRIAIQIAAKRLGIPYACVQPDAATDSLQPAVRTGGHDGQSQ